MMRAEFLAYDAAHRGGVRVAVGDSKSGTPQIVTAPINGGPDVKMFDIMGTYLSNDTEFEAYWMGSWDAASYKGQIFMTTGPGSRRRTSVRELDFRSENTRHFTEGD
jgi:hypothetical protein